MPSNLTLYIIIAVTTLLVILIDRHLTKRSIDKNKLARSRDFATRTQAVQDWERRKGRY